MRLARRLRNERDPADDLSVHHFAVLGTLWRNGAMSIGDLAAAEKVQPPSMTRVVVALEGMGLVTRTPHPTDGRQVIIGLTSAADELLSAEARAREAWLSERLQELSAEEREVLRESGDEQRHTYATQLARFLLARFERTHAPLSPTEHAIVPVPRIDPNEKSLKLSEIQL